MVIKEEEKKILVPFMLSWKEEPENCSQENNNNRTNDILSPGNYLKATVKNIIATCLNKALLV